MQSFACCPKRTCVLGAILCFALTPALLAQTGEIRGTVYDETPSPVDGLNARSVIVKRWSMPSRLRKPVTCA